MDDAQLFYLGVTTCASLVQALFGTLLFRQHRFNPDWGLNWLGLALFTGSLANLSQHTASGLWIESSSVMHLGLALQFITGFLSLAALLSGTLLYTGIRLKHPTFTTVAFGILLLIVTVIGVSIGISQFGRFVAIGVFLISATLAGKAHQNEPEVGFRSLAVILYLYPIIVLPALFIFPNADPLVPIAAITYAAIGLMILMTVLGRRTSALKIAIDESNTRAAKIHELNESLEQRVEERTKDLHKALDDLQKTQKQLVQNEKLAGLGSLVAGISHELNTPLGNALTMTSTLIDSEKHFKKHQENLTRKSLADFQEDLDEGLNLIERNLTKAAGLVKSFKQISVDQTNFQATEFSLSEELQQFKRVFESSLAQRNINLAIDVREDFRLTSFAAPLFQVIENLVSNARIHAFAPDQAGNITIEAALESKDTIRLSVIDDGQGISLSDQTRIFDPFFTSQLGQGTSGLGLHITYNLVTGLLGGEISVDSQPGVGTVFTVRLPVKPQPND